MMKVKTLRADQIYQKLIGMEPEHKVEQYRQQMLLPFMNKWTAQQIPYKADSSGAFDVIAFNNVMNIAPQQITSDLNPLLEVISSEEFWDDCDHAVQHSLSLFEQNGIQLHVTEYVYTVLLGDFNSSVLAINESICGDGGIPGSIMVTFIPNEYTLSRIPSVLAHECNHNVRYQFVEWNYQRVTLGELIVSEGLAENFATSLYGEHLLGPWVSKTDMDTLNNQIKPLLADKLDLTGFDQISPYLYGDEIAGMQCSKPVGMPYAGGYACGYYLIQHYMKKTGKSIIEATITPAELILAESKEFWHETTIIYYSKHSTHYGHY